MPDIDRAAVLEAIAEFDALGRDVFLKKYRFGRALEYFLLHNGNFYDSKAIFGVAASKGAANSALSADTFSGGERTVQRALTRLGFVVLKTRLPDPPPSEVSRAVMLTWNPDRWPWSDRAEVATRVGAGEAVRLLWSSGNTRSLPVGTRAFLLKQGTEPRGLVASGWTVSQPVEQPHWDSERAANGDTALYVEVAFDSLLHPSAPPIDVRMATGPLSAINWAIPASGTTIVGDAYLALEGLWSSRPEASVDGSPWSTEEIRASVVAYLDMLARCRYGQKYVKSDYYRELAETFGRTEKSFEYRMQNISYVRSISGRDWIPGLRPAKNVGAAVANEIETVLAEIEARPIDPLVAFETQVSASLSKEAIPTPNGNPSPAKSNGTTTLYERDPVVKAWVLRNANGICECCRKPAPFATPQGPYLEVHHVRRLADGGSDTIDNTVAICPNCHRELHFGNDAAALIARLYGSIGRLRSS